jgi:hypothetical protein
VGGEDRFTPTNLIIEISLVELDLKNFGQAMANLGRNTWHVDCWH